MARLEVITGPMFSGKSEELIKRLHTALHGWMNTLVIQPRIDTRTSGEIASRKKNGKNDKHFQRFSSFPAHVVGTVEEAKELLELHNPNILAIDEGQFMDNSFVGYLKKLLKLKKYEGLTIMISGLDMTSEGEPFGPMPQFMAMANEVTKLRAVCFKCKKWPPTATMTFSKIVKNNPIAVGGENEYEARCRKCCEEAPLTPE